MGLRDRLSRALNQHTIYKTILADKQPPSPYLYKLREEVKHEVREQLATMSREEKKIWQEQHREGKKLIYETLEKLKDFKRERANEYFSIDNLDVINHEIYNTETQLQGELFNKLRRAFVGKPYDREREMAINTFELEIGELSRRWKKVRELFVEHAKLKDLVHHPEKIAKASCCCLGMHVTKRDLDRLIYLEKKYFSDSPLEKYLAPIKEIVSQNEKMQLEVYKQWTQRERYQQDNAPREPLLHKTNRALQNKVQDNNKTEGIKERSGAREEKLISVRG
ncbi:MAG TPA: hypothetical protein GX532_00630 [Clostridia bacterium]|jgi:hypothetical protein|nr:hypothetical protein [Clostridia bacterium]HHY05478.1 hypothetical protein [Clostridia bacterium]